MRTAVLGKRWVASFGDRDELTIKCCSPYQCRYERENTSLTMALPQPFTVTVHPLTSPAYPHAYSCAYEQGNTSSPNALIYVGGLTSGPHTALDLSKTLLLALDDAGLGYSIWECRMRSSFTGWGYSCLKDDVEDIAALVKYLMGLGKKRVVLLGSSTGEVTFTYRLP